MLLALSQQWKSIRISLHIVGGKRHASASKPEKGADNAEWALVVHVRGRVKMRHALATERTGEQILMVVDDDSHSILTESVDERVNLVQVVRVVHTGRPLDGLPHDAKTHNLGAPILHVLEILIGDRHVKVKMVLNRNVVWLLDDSVEAVEDSGATLLIAERARRGVDSELLSGGCGQRAAQG